ncbi:hypothetical protein CI109_100446 [Kwoniella shandongensis]|uniref:Asl1-like glycosyl hydrolase catalytic domain-containing protein n=1 Tax=Kwoniella shandongensis TaxID=1734106 RepID=A0A5M6C7K0_9TREE|nr:uncharacterized protein CI109_001711 [Kwoniella shandongensis]KAA5529772.1 hypothetical protein CI109_001711 [Kwoniella shandongensis]
MPAMNQLLNLLPTLALLGLALTGVEAVPSAVAAGHKVYTGRDHHRHLAEREAIRVNGGNGHTKKRRVIHRDGKIIRRKADGTQCRVRGQAGFFSSSITSTSSVTPTATSTSSVESASSTDAAVSATSDAAAVENWAAPTASSAAPAATSAVSSSSSSISSGGWVNAGSKLGAAWPNGDWAQSTDPNYIGNYIGQRTAWYYTWSPFSVSSGDRLGLEFVPMLWGPKQVSDWYAQMNSWPSTVKNALFFNEPNQSGQCDISAGDAVSYWMNDFLPIRASKGIRLGGAATTSAPSGLQWIKDFQTACTGAGNSAADCTMDFVPIHWYDTTAENFKAYVENFHSQTGLNIWVTEYACQNFNGGAQCTDQESWNLHTEMAGWFDQQSYIERYSPFGVMADMQGVNQNNALMNPDGSITSLGGWYITSA